MIPSWWNEFSSMSIFKSGPRFGLAMVSLTFGGFSGGLIFGGTTMGGTIVSGGSAMPSGDCWIILLGTHLMLLFSLILLGNL